MGGIHLVDEKEKHKFMDRDSVILRYFGPLYRDNFYRSVKVVNNSPIYSLNFR